MITIIQIGNSDNKLTQAEWADYLACVHNIVNSRSDIIHFFGCSNPEKPWQNAAWIFELSVVSRFGLVVELSELCKTFNQDSIAFTEGNTQFIKPTT